MSVVPNTSDEEDIQAADVGASVLKHIWRSKTMRKKWRLTGGWVYATGNAFLGDRWNPKGGKAILDKEGKLVYEGDVAVDVWSPFEIVVPAIPNGPVDVHSMPWLIKIRWRDMSWFQQNFGAKGATVEPEHNAYGSLDLGMMMMGTQGSMERKLEGAWMINLYVQPNEEYPKGMFVAAANGTIFQQTDYPLTEYPLEHFVDIDLPGMFWGKATIEDAIPLQVRWNAVVDDMTAYAEFMAKGRLLTPKKSNVEIIPDGAMGEMISYNPVLGHKPEFARPPGGSPAHGELLNVLHQSLQDTFHQHEVSRGTNKSDIRSGDMAQFLQEQDAFGGIPTHATAEESLEALFSRVLQRVQKGYKNERVIKVVGEKGRNSVISFQGADLRGNNDVSVKRQSMLPDSRVARQRVVENRFQAGFYGNPADPNIIRKVGRMVEDAVTEDIYSSFKLDETVAESENFQISQHGAMVVVNSYDNHQIHLEEHNNYRKQPRYQRLKFEDPKSFLQLEVLFEQHTQQHQKYLQEQQEMMLRRAMAMKEGGMNGQKSKRGAA
jgi:hypothetical protein